MAENYFVYGDEEYLVKAKVKELTSSHSSDGWDVEKLETLTDLESRVRNQSMFSMTRIFTIEYQALTKAKNPAELKPLLEEHQNILLIFAPQKPDKRTQIFKLLNKCCKKVEVVALKGHELQQWANRKAKELGAQGIEPQAIPELIFLAGSNMLTLENELIKLVNYDPNISVKTVQTLAVRDIQVSIFDLVDQVTTRNTPKAQNLVASMLKNGAAEPYILQMLARQYRLLFRMRFFSQQGYGSSEVQKHIQMHPYAFKKTWQQASNLSLEDCSRALQLLADADYAFKTGKRQGLNLLQTLIQNIAT